MQSEWKAFFIICTAVLIAFASCDASGGGSGPDYGAVSVEAVTVAEITGSYSGRDVTSVADFEEKLLGPLMEMLIQEEADQMTSSMQSNTAELLGRSIGPGFAMETVIDEEASETETIDFSTEPDGPFTSGTLTTTGSYDILAQRDDETFEMLVSAVMDVQSTLSDATAEKTDDLDNVEYVYTVSGQANVSALADFNMSMEQTSDSSGAIRIRLGYGVAFSAVVIIDVDDQTGVDEDDVGAIISLNLNVSGKNNTDYPISESTEMDVVMEQILDDSIPDSATLTISVYDSDKTLIFTESYDASEIMTMMEDEEAGII